MPKCENGLKMWYLHPIYWQSQWGKWHEMAIYTPNLWLFKLVILHWENDDAPVDGVGSPIFKKLSLEALKRSYCQGGDAGDDRSEPSLFKETKTY